MLDFEVEGYIWELREFHSQNAEFGQCQDAGTVGRFVRGNKSKCYKKNAENEQAKGSRKSWDIHTVPSGK